MKALGLAAAPNALRRKLMLGLPGSLALMSPLALVACGGSDDVSADSDPPAGVTLPPMARSAVAVKVALPAGTGISLANCQLMTGNNVSDVAADGTAGAVLLSGAPQMAYLFAADGRLLLIGAVEAGKTAMNSRTTAEALIFIASEVALLEPALQIALRQALQTHAVVEPVRVAVEAALLRGGISDEDPGLMAALTAAEAVICRREPAVASSAAKRAQARKVTIDPAELVSGVRVKRDAAFNSVVLENTFRRRAYAWVEQVGYFDRNGVQQSLPAPHLEKELDVSATTPLSFDSIVIKVGDFLAGLLADIGLIGDIQQGTGPFIATTSAPIFLPIFPDDAQSSLFRVRVVGIGQEQTGVALTAQEADRRDTLLVATVWEDIVVPIMQTLVLPLISDRLGKVFQTEVQKLWLATMAVDAVNITLLTSLLPNTWDRVQKGDADGAFGAFWKEFVSSNTLQDMIKMTLNSLIIASVGADAPGLQVLDGNGNLVAMNLNQVQGKLATFQAALGKVAKIVAIVKAAATVADFAAMAKDWASSQQRCEFALTSSGTTITFTPAAASAMPGGSVPLKAALGETTDIGAGSTIRYEWSVSGAAGGTLRNPANQSTGTTITTSTDTVDYVAAAGATAGATDSVSVKATLTDIGTSITGVIAVAMVPAVVTISAVKLTPASVDFKVKEAGQRQDFTVEFSTGFGSSFGLVYEWTCASTFGFISDNTLISNSAAPTFRSTLPKVTYSSGAVAVGGETELVKVRVLRITSAPGAVIETTETVATLESKVKYGAIELVMSPGKPMDAPTDTRFGVSAHVKNPLPAGSTVTWSWTVSGAGSLSNEKPFDGGAGGAVDLTTGSADGTATVTATATVIVPGAPATTVVTDPVSAVVNVRKGLRQIVLEASGGIFGCTDPLACGVSAYTAFIVPYFEKATGYSAALSGFGFAGCNRTETWRNETGPVGDRGGCRFPITYHPHSSAGKTNQWAVWNGFGGALDGDDKCVVTITLAP